MVVGDGGRKEWVGGEARASVVGRGGFVGPTDDAAKTIEDWDMMRLAANGALFGSTGRKAEVVVPADGSAVAIV